MKKSYFAPDNFEVNESQRAWAKSAFSIEDAEVDRQTEEWMDHEYKRAYSDWNRAWKRWMRQADKYGTLKRRYKLRAVDELTPEQREADILAFERDPMIRKALGK